MQTLMGKNSQIEWTTHTFNPWWGCIRVSPGCENCYAESQAKRYGLNVWGPASTTNRRVFSDKHWHEPLVWNKAAPTVERPRVFCASFADVFESNDSIAGERARLFELIRQTPRLDWLLLTKRPENIADMLPDGYWPNIWLGTSTENQEYADRRVPLLLSNRNRVPVLFASAEPLLGPIQFGVGDQFFDYGYGDGYSLDWVITGGESGPRHRRFELDWVRQINRQCEAAGVAHFFKQVGGRTHAEGGCDLDGIEVKQFPEPRRASAI